MNTARVARAAIRARPTAFRALLQRRTYADVAPDKIQLSLALPHQSIYKSQDVYVSIQTTLKKSKDRAERRVEANTVVTQRPGQHSRRVRRNGYPRAARPIHRAIEARPYRDH